MIDSVVLQSFWDSLRRCVCLTTSLSPHDGKAPKDHRSAFYSTRQYQATSVSCVLSYVMMWWDHTLEESEHTTYRHPPPPPPRSNAQCVQNTRLTPDDNHAILVASSSSLKRSDQSYGPLVLSANGGGAAPGCGETDGENLFRILEKPLVM